MSETKQATKKGLIDSIIDFFKKFKKKEITVEKKESASASNKTKENEKSQSNSDNQRDSSSDNGKVKTKPQAKPNLDQSSTKNKIPFTYGTEGWDKPTEWIVEKFLLKRSVGMVIGESQSLKTFAMIEMAGCIGTGKRFGNLHTESGLVVIVAAESPGSIPKRLKGFELQNNNEYIIDNNVIVINVPLCMADSCTVKNLTRFIEEQEKLLGKKASLVIFDTFSANAIGIEENAAKDVASYLRGCNELAISLDACVLSVHHHNKKGSFRGSSAFYCNVDLVFEVKRRNCSKTISTDVVVTKSKDGVTGSIATLTFSENDLKVKDNAGNSTLVLACNDISLAQNVTEVESSLLDKDSELMIELLTSNSGSVKQSLLKECIKKSEPNLAQATLNNRATAVCKLLTSQGVIRGFKEGTSKCYHLVDSRFP